MKARLSQEPVSPALHPLLPLLLLLFFGSGCAALIYEIVWFQMLELVIGSSAVSLGVLVGTYMGGMCLGSVVLPRIISPARHPLRVYALLEFGIGLLGILILLGMPAAAQVYSAHVGSGLGGILLRGLFASVCLLPPTILMGATLPAIARRLESTPQGVSWLGFFYGGNIAGAVFGCLLAGFYLLRVYDSAVATFVAAAVNGAVALAAVALSVSARFGIREEAGTAPDGVEPQIPPSASRDPASTELPAWPAYVAIALSGLTALGAEVVWTRLLSLTLGGTVYAFSIILAVFLFGLGIGSSVGSALARKSPQPGMLLGGCQFLLTAAIFWTAYMLAKSLPYWPINPSLTVDVWADFHLDMARCLWALLPATLLWGASFPLALAAAARGQDPGRLVGGVYAANTVGGILGGVGFSMIFIPWIDTQNSQRLLVCLAAAAAVLMFAASARHLWTQLSLAAVGGILGGMGFGLLFVPWFRTWVGLAALAAVAAPLLFVAFTRHHWARGSLAAVGGILTGLSFRILFGFSNDFIPWYGIRDISRPSLIGLAALGALLLIVAFTRHLWMPVSPAAVVRRVLIFAALVLFAAGLADCVARIPDELVAFGRFMLVRKGLSEIKEVGEGMNNSVAVSEDYATGVHNFHISGKVEASSDPPDMRLQRMLGHLPALVHPHPGSVLIVGCGAGVTAGTFTQYESIEKITICEMEPLVPPLAAEYFEDQNYGVVRDPRTKIVFDDARHYIFTTRDKFDVITSDPIHPWVKGSATLYTQEYFELVKSHLNPGGVVAQWVPLYESDAAVVKSEIATFFQVFPGGTIWSNDVDGEGYDLVLLGQAGETEIDLDAIQQRLEQPDHAGAARSLGEVYFQSALGLFVTYAGQASDLAPWLQDAEINRDRNLRLQYLAGFRSTSRQSGAIFKKIVAFRKFHDTLFKGSAAKILQLKIESENEASK
jgi:predicted membrane-bound spermidine synthase